MIDPAMGLAGTRHIQGQEKGRPPTRDELAKAADGWLKRRGVPLFVDKPENRRLHVLVVLVFAVAYGALLVGTTHVARGADVALTLGGPVLVMLAIAGYRWGFAGERDVERLLPAPLCMSGMVAVAIAADGVLDAILREQLQWSSALRLAAALAALLLIAATTLPGAVRIIGWAMRHPFREARQTARVLAGAIPFLLLTLAFLLLTTELWTVASHLSDDELLGALSLFAALGLALFVFEAFRIERAAEFRDWPSVRRAMRDEHEQPVAPMEALVDECVSQAGSFGSASWFADRLRAVAAADPADEPDLAREQELLVGTRSAPEVKVEFLRVSRWPSPLPEVEQVTKLGFLERWNITIVVAFALSVQVLAVSLVMFAFFLVFGWITVDGKTLTDWEVDRSDGWLGLSEQHWKVSALLAAFAGLSYAVSVALFKEQRDLFLGELDRKVTQRLAVRALYCGLTRGPRS